MKTPLSEIMRIMLISFLQRHFIPVATSYFKYIILKICMYYYILIGTISFSWF